MGFYLLNPHGAEINTKSRGHCWRLRLGGAGGADRRKTSFPSCRHRHPHRHAVHDASSDHGKKSRRWREKKSGWRREKKTLAVKKVRLAPVQKQLLGRSPSPALLMPLPNPPQGAGVHSCCVLGGFVERPPLGRVGVGLLESLGWGFQLYPT
ncbi:unknown [Prevotella sp. CAG:474]|nr:unknown [Prevotella sp. CAG:474]